ncbi:hypothetical protein H6F76_16250 [Leptolyngbya sp. FACHB-321]|nr:hypothetical protein [Leptolyngbya sp. FACHB-321]MBD2036565.1 hypothetical protein [Leptolyngbya sp. FACHB-321]
MRHRARVNTISVPKTEMLSFTLRDTAIEEAITVRPRDRVCAEPYTVVCT